MLWLAWVSNADGTSVALQDKLPIVETHVDVTNELDETLVGDSNLCPNHAKK